MKHDSQHLEFLISQYVDNVLDAPNRKFVEQQLSADGGARDLLKEHREVQDLLDDYGSRLAMIDWNDFDATLAARLDAEAAPKRVSPWRRWIRPASAAAALLVAAGMGYGWHAYWRPGPTEVVVNHPAAPQVPAETHVNIADRPQAGGSIVHVNVAEDLSPSPTQPAVSIHPGDSGPILTSPPYRPGGVTAEGPQIAPPAETGVH